MAFTLQKDASDYPVANPTQRAVLSILCEIADDDGHHVFPSYPHLAHRASCSKSTVSRTINALRKDGVVVVVREGDARTNTPAEYRLDVDRLHREAEGAREARAEARKGRRRGAHPVPHRDPVPRPLPRKSAEKISAKTEQVISVDFSCETLFHKTSATLFHFPAYTLFHIGVGWGAYLFHIPLFQTMGGPVPKTGGDLFQKCAAPVPPAEHYYTSNIKPELSDHSTLTSFERRTRANEPSTGCAKVGSKARLRREALDDVDTVASAEPIAAATGSPGISPPIADQPAATAEPQGSAAPDVIDVAFVEVTASGVEPNGGSEPAPEPGKPAKATKATRKSAKAATEAEAFTILRECLSAETARDVIEHRLAKKKPFKTSRAARELAKAFVESGNPERAAAKLIQMDWTGYNPNWTDCKFEPDVPPIEDALIRGALCAILSDQTAGAVLAHLVAKGARITSSPQAEKLAKAFVESGDAERAAARMIERGWKSFDPTWPGCNFTQPQQGPAQQHYGAPQSSMGRFNAASAQIDRQMAEYAKRHAPKF